MTGEELHNSMEEIFQECLAICEAKNADYAGVDDAFANFRIVDILGISPVSIGILVRLSDKIGRLLNLLAKSKRPAVKDESLHDTIRDAINYLAILDVWLQNQDK